MLLLIHGLVAGFCGYTMMKDPTGKAMGLDMSLLTYSPFGNYFIPGIILFSVLGIGCLFTGIVAIIEVKYYPKLIILSGLSIIIWIIVQIALLQILFFMQYIILSVGLIVFICGAVINRWNNIVASGNKQPTIRNS
jgi:hypothetical protein